MNENEKHAEDCRWMGYGTVAGIPARFDHQFDFARCGRCQYLENAEYADRLLREHGISAKGIDPTSR